MTSPFMDNGLLASTLSRISFWTLISIFLVACGGGGGDDGGGDATNQAPVAVVGNNQVVDVLSTVALSGSGTDSDGSVDKYLWQQLSGTSVVIANINSATTSFTAPDVQQSEILQFSLTVTDNDGATDSDDISITVNPLTANVPPTANAGTDQTIAEFNTVALNGSGIDSDGTVSTYLWQQISGTAVILVNAGQTNASFTAPDVTAAEELIFRLTVTDNDNATGSDEVVVTVTPLISIDGDLIAHYQFDGNASDATGNGFNGAEMGGVGYTTGVTGQALSLDGIDDYVEITSAVEFDLSNVGTVCAWIQNTGTAESDVIVSKYQDNTDEEGYLIQLAASGPVAMMKTDNGVDVSQAGATHSYDSNWFHFCLVNTGDQVKAFLNGTETETGNTLSNAFSGNSQDVLVGATHDVFGAPANFFDGNIDDLRFYNKALSSVEIESFMVCTASCADVSKNDNVRANSYDDAWQSAWVANAKIVLATQVTGITDGSSGIITKTEGKVLQVGDSMTFSIAYGNWPRQHVGASSEDLTAIQWMHADSYNVHNGWDYSSGGVTAENNMGWGNDRIINNIYVDSRLNDAQFAILMMNNPTSDPTDVTIVERRVNEFIAAGIMPILSTVPPRIASPTNPDYVKDITEPYNEALRSLAQELNLPFIDYFQEILLRRPGSSWELTLIGRADSDGIVIDGVHPTAGVDGFSGISDPYLPGGDPVTHTTGDATLNSGYLLRTWLSIQKIKEIKQYVVDEVTPPDCGC